MTQRASGAPHALRTLFLVVIRAGNRALASLVLIRTGAVALVLTGLVGHVASAVFLVEAYQESRDPGSISYVVEGSLLELLFVSQGAVRWLGISLGLLGLYAVLARSVLLPRRLALIGAVLVTVATSLFLWEEVRLRLFGAENYSPLPELVYFGLPTGVVLSGVAAVWARGLGRFRFLVSVVCLLATPLASLLLSAFLYPDEVMMIVSEPISFGTEVLIAAHQFLTDVGFVLFGAFLFGAKEREAKLVARERRELETRNLALARHLYEKAWVEGDLSAVDELVAEDVLDNLHDRRGREDFRRAIVGLRRSFPDLSVRVEEQTAEDDTVTTRCAFSGTDRGGILWYPPTNRPADFTDVYVDRFSGDAVVEHGGETGTARLLEQLGLPPVGKG